MPSETQAYAEGARLVRDRQMDNRRGTLFTISHENKVFYQT